MADDERVSAYEEFTTYRPASTPQRPREQEVSAEEARTSRIRMALGNMRFDMAREGKLAELIANAPCLERGSLDYLRVREFATSLRELGANMPDYSKSGTIKIIQGLEDLKRRTAWIRNALSAKPRE